jgi:AraC family transcriptional regulator
MRKNDQAPRRRIWYNLCPTMKATTLRDYKTRLLRVLVHIQQHLDEPLSLDELAARACLSPFHFHRVFTGMLGESLQCHIRRLRLERAAWQLKLGRAPVVQIALGAGYETHEAFSRAFRSAFRLSPTQYRRRHAASPTLPARSHVHYLRGAPLRNFQTTHPMNPSSHVTIQQLAPQRVAFMRHVGPYDGVGPTWEKLTMLLGKDGLLGPDSRFFGLCHDDPEVTPPDKIRYDACVTVGDDFSPHGEIGMQVISGGEYATMVHAGPYHRLGASYRKLLGQWLPRSGRSLRAVPCFEQYLNSPDDTAPAELLTEIHAPLEPL